MSIIKEAGIVNRAVIFHDILNPKLFRNGQMIPRVRYKLLKIAQHFIEFIDIPSISLRDITISGSNAAYTYTNNSDIDLHLIVAIPEDQESQLRQLYDAKKNQYNFNHDITIKDIDVELYVQGQADVSHSAGIYSILDDKWIAKARPVKVKINDVDVEQKVDNYSYRINAALESNNLNDVERVQYRLTSLRNTGLEREGEFSVENIAYKVLRSQGLLEKLYNHKLALQDQKLSLEGMVKVTEITKRLKEETPVVGKVSQTTSKDVTIENPDGTKTVVPNDSNLISTDPLTKQLVLKKGEDKTNPNKPAKVAQAGQQIKISTESLDSIVKLAGIK